MELRFTPRTVKEIEDRARGSIVTMISDYSISNLALLVEKGAGLKNETEALDLIEKELENPENDTIKMFLRIIQQLQEAGFLPRKAVNMTEAIEAMDSPEKMQELQKKMEIENSQPSQNLG